METVETTSLRARDELFVAADVVRRLNYDFPDILDSEIVVAVNTLPVIAAFLTNCQDSRLSGTPVKQLHGISKMLAEEARKRGLGRLVDIP